MRKNKLILFSVLILALSLLFTGCGEQKGQQDVALDDLSAAIEGRIEGSESLVYPGDSYIAGRMKLNKDELGEFVIKIGSGANINEYGVFKAADADGAKAIAAELEAYLARRIDEWMPEYMPEEFPKLENAEVRQDGAYVVYTILSDAEREAVFSEFESMLTK